MIAITLVETPAGYMRFSPQALHVKSGMTMRVTFRNESPREHAIYLGAQHEVEKLRSRRAAHPQAPIDTTDTLRIPAGGDAQLIWRFTGTEPVDFLCLLPGHFEAGLRGLFVVHDHGTEPEQPSSLIARP
ncbi:hypothetical protein [Sulfitobacter aestuarii]|uniref:hypothetical protein n=1 Tax=Sulfitobacter aestuarii TaxID=2161676 RepID=UPI0036DE11A3